MRAMPRIPMFTHNHPVQPGCPYCGWAPMQVSDAGEFTVRATFVACGCLPMQRVTTKRRPKEKR